MTDRFVSELGELAQPAKLTLPLELGDYSPEKLWSQIEAMLLIRHAEEGIADMITDNLVKTPCHLGIGQEAVAVGVCEALTSADKVFGGHRSHGPYLALGCSLGGLMAEVLGRATGCSRGMGGSMHLSGREEGFWGSAPMVAGTIPIAVGAALAAKMENDHTVSVCFFGDGATEEGAFHESLNLAATFDLPVIFVCENNLYASHLDIEQRQPSDRVARFAEAHKIRTAVVDGNDIIAVTRAAEELARHARTAGGPVFLEAVTYRWRGHVGPGDDIDVGVRRCLEDVAAWKIRDPIKRAKEGLVKAGFIVEEEFQALSQRLIDRVARSRMAALEAPYPNPTALLDLVYAEG